MLRKLAKPVTGGEPAGLSLFCYIGVNTMAKKTFASFEQQIQHLEDKGIIISDRAYAEAMLKQIGYFPLIGGYKHLFRVPFTKTYKIGTTFEEIVDLYEFDSDLRDLFFKYLLQIERNLRSLMSYYFTEKYGESQDAYTLSYFLFVAVPVSAPSPFGLCFFNRIPQLNASLFHFFYAIPVRPTFKP